MGPMTPSTHGCPPAQRLRGYTKAAMTVLVSLSVVSTTSPLASGAVVEPGPAPGTVVSPQPASAAPLAAPTLRVTTAMSGLDIPWDVAVLPSGRWLVTERDRKRVLLRSRGGSVRAIVWSPSGMWSSGETGLMSVVRDPRFATNQRFYTCHGYLAAAGPQIRVVAWKLGLTGSAHQLRVLFRGIQVTTGRHGGCRLRFGGEGALYVGTGDAAVGTNPQNLRSPNGKVLRLNARTGDPWPSNPWLHAASSVRRYIYTYGHRNVQGLAWRPGGNMWSVEHGTDRDDEVNHLVAGGNYGWNPVPGYDESTPMTDYSLPGVQRGARWSSGYPTLATSGAVWVRGREWGAYRGMLAVCALKASKLVLMRFDRAGKLLRVRVPAALNGTFGRLRSVVQDIGGDLLVTTSNGGGADRVLRVHPF